MTSANEPAGGILDGWDDELNDWAEGKPCTRLGPNGETCTQPYDHTGRCDWFAAALKLATRGGGS